MLKTNEVGRTSEVALQVEEVAPISNTLSKLFSTLPVMFSGDPNYLCFIAPAHDSGSGASIFRYKWYQI